VQATNISQTIVGRMQEYPDFKAIRFILDVDPI